MRGIAPKSRIVVEQARAHPSGRIDGVIAPSQIETCSEELIQEAVAEARSRGMRVTIHAAQTMAEHEELLRRTGETAPALLERLGVLGSDLILGHCIFLDHHSWTRQRSRDDLARLADANRSPERTWRNASAALPFGCRIAIGRGSDDGGVCSIEPSTGRAVMSFSAASERTRVSSALMSTMATDARRNPMIAPSTASCCLFGELWNAAGVAGSFGTMRANAAFRAADVVLVLGCKLGQVTTHAWQLPHSGQAVIHVDVDGEEIGRTCETRVGIVADARLTAEALGGALHGRRVGAENWLATLAEVLKERV